MRIGLILHKMNPDYKGGVSSYILGLLEGFKTVDRKNTYILFVDKKNRYFFEKFKGNNFIIEEISIHKGRGLVLWIKNKLSRLIIDYFAVLPGIRMVFSSLYKLAFRHLILLIDKSSVDIIYCPHEQPIYWKKPTVVSIHDIQHIHYPGFFSFGQRWHRYTFYKETVKGAEIVQASSNYIKEDFINYFNLMPSKVITIRDGFNSIFRRKINARRLIDIKRKYKLPDSFIFYPAQHWSHKNHLNLIKAISYLKRQRNLKISLVFTGEINKRFQFLYDVINKSDIKKDIKLLGNVPFEDLPFLYKLATIMVMPSFHESNSLPILEALTVGCPVAASDIGPNIELNINKAITIFDPNDYKDIAEKIQLLWKNKTLREEKIKLGQELAAEFSWKKTAKNYISTFEKIYKNFSI